MKFLGDMGLALSTFRSLRGRGHDALHLREEGLQRLPDEDILVKAQVEGRVILTFDLGFGDLLALGAHTLPSVIIFRLHDATPSAVTAKLLDLLAERSRELEEGAVVVVEDTRYRLRRLPIRQIESE